MSATAAENGHPGRYRTGARRRTELLESVLRVIAREGLAAVTHRAVASEAGVSHRLTTYYFHTKEQMILEAFRHLAARSLARTHEAARSVADAGDRESAMQASVDAVVDATRGALRTESGDAVAELSLVLEIERTGEPSLIEDYAAWQEELESILLEHARSLGSEDPRGEARIILAFMRGLQLEALGRPDRPLDRADIRALTSRLLNAL